MDWQGLLTQVSGLSIERWAGIGLAWARSLPVVLLVPAFGLRALPLGVRLSMALVLAVSIAPTELPHEVGTHFLSQVAAEAAFGSLIALSTATLFWVATQLGNLIDEFSGRARPRPFSVVEAGASPLGVLFALTAALLFFELGGVSQVVRALAEPRPVGTDGWLVLGLAIARSAQIAVALAAPVVVATILFEVFAVVTVHWAGSTAVDAVVAPLRAFFLLAVLAVFFQTLVSVYADWLGTGLAGLSAPSR